MAWMPEPDKNGGVKRAKASVQMPVVKIILTASCAELQCRGEGGRPAPLLNTIALDEIFERGELPLTNIYQVWQEDVGDAIAGIDLDDEWRLADIYAAPDSRYWEQPAPNYDVSTSGGDFFLNVTFADDSFKRVIIADGSFRAGTGGRLDSEIPEEAMDPTSSESFSGWWHAALETDGKAVTSICLFYAPWLYRGLHAREPQLITCWAPQGPDDAYPNVEVRPKAEHIPSAAVFEAALVAPQVFEYDVTIKATGGPCAVAQTYLLMHAIERAVWNAIRGDRASVVAPSTSVSMRCMCLGASCPDDCARHGFVYPPQYPHVAAADVVRPSVPSDGPVPPVCGCDFASYDFASDTCGDGYTHVSELTRKCVDLEAFGEGGVNTDSRWSDDESRYIHWGSDFATKACVDGSDDVYYYVNDAGEKLWHGEAFGTSARGSNENLDEAIAACRNHGTCNTLVYERPNKYWLVSGRNTCMSPCFQRDYWGRVAYMVDGFENPFEQRVEIEDSITSASPCRRPTSNCTRGAHKAGQQYAHVDVMSALSDDADFIAAWPQSISSADVSAARVGQPVASPQPPAVPPSPSASPAPPPLANAPPAMPPSCGTLSFPGRVVLPDLTTDARELHFQPGAVFNKGLAATAVPATNPVPTAELKKWYISAIDDGDLKVFELDVRYSGGELFVKAVRAVHKLGMLLLANADDPLGPKVESVDEVDVNAEFERDGFEEQELATQPSGLEL